MAEKTTYELKGTLRVECMKDTATLDGFRALECDWHELFRWLMSVSGDLPLRDADGKETDRLSCLWKDHVLVVLVEIVRKHLGSYITSFVEGQGTSAQKWFTRKLMNNCTDWILRLDRFIRMSHGYSSDSPAMLVALEIKERLESALPSRKEEKRMRSMPSFMDNRSQPYYQMLGVLEDIQAQADIYMDRIESGGDMDASLALLLTMVRNYCGIVSNFNGRFSDWTEFYRREILHDKPKGAVQDGTYVTVIPDRNRTTETFSLPRGTVFRQVRHPEAMTCSTGSMKRRTLSPATWRLYSRYSARTESITRCPCSRQRILAPLFSRQQCRIRGTRIRVAGRFTKSRSIGGQAQRGTRILFTERRRSIAFRPLDRGGGRCPLIQALCQQRGRLDAADKQAGIQGRWRCA